MAVSGSSHFRVGKIIIDYQTNKGDVTGTMIERSSIH